MATSAPGGRTSSRPSGSQPTTRVPSRSREARPNGTPRWLATAPAGAARTSTLDSGVWSASRNPAVERPAYTCQPATSVTGSGWAIGLRAIGPALLSATQAHPLGVEVGEMLGDPGGHVAAVG